MKNINGAFAPVCLMAAFALLAAVSNAAYVSVVQPFNATVHSNGSIYLGKVGPGQPFNVTISSVTPNANGLLLNRGWNLLEVANVPSGWVAENSSLYNERLSVRVRVAPNTTSGIYSFNLTAINAGNYSGIGSIEFHALINVTPDVFKLDVYPTSISAGPGQPAEVHVTINNTGVSDSPFVISVGGLPTSNFSEDVIALHHTYHTFTYPVYADAPGQYTASISVASASSPQVSKSSDVSLFVGASVYNDYLAIGEGVLSFPIVYEPAYALAYFLAKLSSYLH